MKKHGYFDTHWGVGWPTSAHINSCLAEVDGREKFFAEGWDGGSLFIEGLNGTGDLTPQTGRVDVSLYFYAVPDRGILLIYTKWDGRIQKGHSYHSRGDLNLLGEYVFSFHETALPVGLIVSFDAGVAAINEFVESDGDLPTAIQWVSGADLPAETYPDPASPIS